MSAEKYQTGLLGFMFGFGLLLTYYLSIYITFVKEVRARPVLNILFGFC